MQLTREAHAARPIADVALDLARDCRHREGHELLASLRVEALDGVQEADRPCLHQIVVLGGAPAVPVGQPLDQGHVELNQALTGPRVALVVIGGEEPAGGRVTVATSLPSR